MRFGSTCASSGKCMRCTRGYHVYLYAARFCIVACSKRRAAGRKEHGLQSNARHAPTKKQHCITKRAIVFPGGASPFSRPANVWQRLWPLYPCRLVNMYGQMAKRSGAILCKLSLVGIGGNTSASWRTSSPLATGACSSGCGRSAHLPSCCFALSNSGIFFLQRLLWQWSGTMSYRPCT